MHHKIKLKNSIENLLSNFIRIKIIDLNLMKLLKKCQRHMHACLINKKGSIIICMVDNIHKILVGIIVSRVSSSNNKLIQKIYFICSFLDQIQIEEIEQELEDIIQISISRIINIIILVRMAENNDSKVVLSVMRKFSCQH